MKKFKEFILSIVIPHRMVRFKDMHILITLFLLLVGFVLSIFSSNARMSSYAEKELYYGDYNSIIEEEIKIDDVEIEINEAKAKYKEGVYQEVLKSVNHEFIVTMVFAKTNISKVEEDENYSNINVENFNVSDYLNYHRASRKANTTYLLYVFTDYSLYSIYNLGQKASGESFVESGELRYVTETVADENAGFLAGLLGNATKEEVVYYLPKDASELSASSYDGLNYNFDPTKWTEVKDDSGKYTKDSTKEITLDSGEKVTIKAMPKYGVPGKEKVYSGINFITESGNVYTNLMDASVKVNDKKYEPFNINTFRTSLRNFVNLHHEARVFIRQDDYKTILMFISLFAFLLIPVLFTVFVWLFTRKRGMNKYKSYLNIMSIIQFIMSLVFFVIGWFVNLLDYMILIFAGLLIVLWYFIFVIYKITNKIEQENIKNDTNNPNTPNKVEPPKVKFKKIDDDCSVIG